MGIRLKLEEFKTKSAEVHNNKYNYDKVIYLNSMTKVIIICPEHGEFLQKPNDHTSSRKGCPACKMSKGESLVAQILQKNNVKYVIQKTFEGCKQIRRLKYDFYLPKEKMLIEFNGKQHYEAIPYWNRGQCTFEQQQYRDNIKKEYAFSQGYRFLVIKYDK